MKVIAACIISVVALLGAQQFTTAAVAAGINNNVAPVGLYAPDRYDGIPEMCLMPMDFGYCRAKVKRYYFDMRRMKCAMFYWGGCAGNINNFKSLDECNKICIDDSYDDSNDEIQNTRTYNNANSNASSSNNNNNSNNNKNNNKVNVNSSSYKSNYTNKNNNNNNNNNKNYKNENRRYEEDKNESFEEDDDYVN